MKSEFFNLYKDEILKISLSENNWIVAKLQSVIDNQYVSTNNGIFKIENCQLLLIPIEDLTEKHRLMLAPLDPAAAIIAMRNFGYCLPYMGKDPFEEGWAIPELPPVISFTSF